MKRPRMSWCVVFGGLLMVALQAGCASFKGALGEACIQQCRKNYLDVQALNACIEQCRGPR